MTAVAWLWLVALGVVAWFEIAPTRRTGSPPPLVPLALMCLVAYDNLCYRNSYE